MAADDGANSPPRSGPLPIPIRVSPAIESGVAAGVDGMATAKGVTNRAVNLRAASVRSTDGEASSPEGVVSSRRRSRDFSARRRRIGPSPD